jgi:inner membrane protein
MAVFETSWFWLVTGLVLLTLEALLPGVFLIWLGMAALFTGAIIFVAPLSAVSGLVLFAVLGLTAILIGRRVQSEQKTEVTDAPFLNDRGKALVGKIYALESAIVEGSGSVRIGDSVWRVSGKDAAAGTHVKITGIDGSTLLVEAA